MKPINILLGLLTAGFVAACGGGGSESADANNATGTSSGVKIEAKKQEQGAKPPKVAPPEPYPRLLPLQLVAPQIAQAGIPLVGVNVSLNNPGADAPNARLRLIIHDKEHRHAGGLGELTPDNVKLEVQEGDTWTPIQLGMIAGGVMGAIGSEGVTAHRERHRRGGFAIAEGMSKTWQLRLTFGVPGTYTLVSAVSPDNGSRHLAQPAHTTIEVQ